MSEDEITVKAIVFECEVTVALVAIQNDQLHMAMRWNEPQPYRKEGKLIPTTNLMGGATGWFVVPFTFAVGISRSLLELQATGHEGVHPEGFRELVEWLRDLELINDAMCY